MANQKPPKPRHHGRDHLPGGEDPIPTVPTAGGVPSIATFWFSDVDTSLTVPPLTALIPPTNIPWAHASLPSTGEVTGPDAFDNINFAKDCITLEYLQTQWDDAGFLKSAVLEADSRIVEADQYALGTAGDGASTAVQAYGDSTSFMRPNIHLTNDAISAVATQSDTVDHTIIRAYLVIFIWSIDGLGYAGGIPGWPA